MLQPKRTKYRKMQKGRIGRIAQRGYTLAFGTFGLKALESAWITERQLEAVRVAITRTTKREVKVYCRVSVNKILTQKPSETRMGSGKGNPSSFVAVIKPGIILYEIEGVNEEIARKAFYLSGKKLPIRTKMVVHHDYKSS